MIKKEGTALLKIFGSNMQSVELKQQLKERSVLMKIMFLPDAPPDYSGYRCLLSPR